MTNEVIDIVPVEEATQLHVTDLVANQSIIKDLSVDQVFTVLKNSIKTLSVESLGVMLNNCNILRENLELTGQKDLLRTLTNRVKDIGKEVKAVEMGFIFYLYKKDVDTIINAVNKDKGFNYLKLTNIESYHRLIPPSTAQFIKNANEIYDKVYILHCDPKGAHEATEKKVAKDKDPIAFGMISRDAEKLYLIASWNDEYCDFTLTELLDAMAEKEIGGLSPVKQMDIPTTVEELVDKLNADAGIWNEVELGVNADRLFTIQTTDFGTTSSTQAVYIRANYSGTSSSITDTSNSSR